jgi:hyperosmotically inducible protein
MKAKRSRLGVAVTVMLMGASLTFGSVGNRLGATASPGNTAGTHPLADHVRHVLVMLPWYGVFDNLEYSIDGDTVILSGQVNRPLLKSDAGAAVRRIEGVSHVVNKIEVLPLSPNDDRIRRAMYRALFSRSGLDRYALPAVPSIHIIVKNGHVTLVGVVGRNAHKIEAGLIANSVHGVFSVTNALTV